MKTYFWPYFISVIIAAPITLLWPWCLYKIIDKKKSSADIPAERVWWIPLLIGVFERGIITTLVGWQVSGAAVFIGAWVAVKTAGGWTTWSKGTTYARAVLFVGLLGNAMSIAFALLGGLMILPKR